jgi:magnesium-transporting ATPase (P-type)
MNLNFIYRPGMDIYAPVSSIWPLLFILTVSLLKDGYEDYKRYRSDKIINSKPVRILKSNGFSQNQTKDIHVGDFILVKGFYIFCLIY